jgi:stearoyl-CoA desaturase (delta-9 desaturase)
MIIVLFVIIHWYSSLFFHSFFLHRYGAHKQFTMSPFWERFFFFCTWFFQGSSFLSPRAYAIMHRMHHHYSDTAQDPHSPHFHSDPWSMMMKTYRFYIDLFRYHFQPDPIFTKSFPEWKSFEAFAFSRFSTLMWIGVYISIYFFFATSPWLWLLLPINIFNGPIQGAIVNWCGHKYGYQNYKNGDKSRNTLIADIFLLGELFQNNHHKYSQRSNFGAKWWEIDPAYPFIKMMSWFRIIRFTPVALERPA